MIRKAMRHMALAVTLCAAVMAASTAHAQTSARQQERERQAALIRERDAAEALKVTARLIEQHQMPCEITEAGTLPAVEIVQDGKSVAADVYEVVCKDQRGYVLLSAKSKLVGDPMGCLQAAELAKASPGSPVCKLKANRAAHYWLTDTAKSKIPNCQIAGARFISHSPATNTEVYEISCKGVSGGIFTVPTHKAADKTVGYMNCLKTADTALKCELTTLELAAQTLNPLVKKNAPDCTVTNARFVGATRDAEYYEIGCQGKAGFVMVTDLDAGFKATVGCDKAATIGGCKFTDTAALAAAGKAKADEAKAKYQTAYTQALSQNNVACTFTDFRRIGRDSATNRDVAEFKCPEAVYGLMAFIPDAGKAEKFENFDCYVATVNKLDCTLTTPDDLKAHLQTLSVGHKSIKPDCVIGEARYAFENAGQVVMEIACINTRGYIAVLNKARTALNPAVPCHIAATNPGVPEKCSIKGNGTKQD
ncbi:hypothetical protein [Asticcacaulis endophyticus]|nr:hypothetical protein [Asticcacaulis endophyticus]